MTRHETKRIMSQRSTKASLVVGDADSDTPGHERPRLRGSLLWIGFAVILAAAVGAVALSLWHDREEAIADGVKESRNLAVVLGGQIERSLQAVDNRLRGLQRRIDEFDSSPSLDGLRAEPFRDLLRERLRSLPQTSHIVVVDEKGRFVVATTDGPTPITNVADRDYFKELAANDDDRLVFSQPMLSRVSGDSVVVLARRIDLPGEPFRGIIFISMKTSHFRDMYDSLATLPQQTFSLLRDDGTFMLRQPDVEDRAGTRIRTEKPFLDIVAKGGGSFRGQGIFDPIVRWIAIHPLAGYPLIVTVAVPEEVLLQHWRANALLTAAGTLVLFVCAFVLLVVMMRQMKRLDASRASLTEQAQVLAHERRQFSTALENMSQGLAMFDRDANLIVANRHFFAMHSIPAEQAPAIRGLRDVLVHSRERHGFPADVDAEIAEVIASVARGESHSRELHADDGRTIVARIDAMADGGWVATLDDVTTQRADEKKIRQLAHHDLLTGIANRPRFLERIAEAREKLWRAGRPFNVMMLDLDHFKTINDSLGHPAGDALLKEMANRLACSLRDTDVLARLGGDEFAIVQMAPRNLDPGRDEAKIMRQSGIALATRIIETVSEPYEIDGQAMVVSVSIGIAMAPQDGKEPDELMKRADLALYRAKSQGRNGYAFFEPEMAEAARERQQLEADLRAGLDRGEFELYYQPQVDVATRRLCGMEALVRWHHPDHGLIAPDRFISLAEDTGLIVRLGEWIMETACRTAAAWPADVKIAINVSPVQFRKSNLLDLVTGALIGGGLAPERLEIEITERLLLADDSNYLTTLHLLKGLGVGIALDDFGTGYSSLGYLTTFPFDKIKIDQSFIRQALDRPECAAITAAIVNLGRSLDMISVAEGVETEQQFALLRAAGAQQAQGYLFGRPAPAGEILFGALDATRTLPAA
jgi:diguanylate cyclase (GGDEF)-like protein